MTTTQLMNASNVTLFALALDAVKAIDGGDDEAEALCDTIIGILKDRGIELAFNGVDTDQN